jgi:hypothetical protein
MSKLHNQLLYFKETVVLCRGCGKNKKLIKAHAIPESFFKGMNAGGKPPQLMSDASGVYPKKSPIGVYDKTILCRECEDKFQTMDDYAQDFLLKKENEHEEIIHKGKVIGYKAHGIDTNLLRLFFIGVLWRASISNHDYYKKVNLGPYEQIAKDLVWSPASGDKGQFSFVLAKFSDKKVGRVMLDPHRDKWHGINYYRFYMFGYILYIKVDKRQTPSNFIKFNPDDKGNLIMVGRDIYNSKELPIMISLVNEAYN